MRRATDVITIGAPRRQNLSRSRRKRRSLASRGSFDNDPNWKNGEHEGRTRTFEYKGAVRCRRSASRSRAFPQARCREALTASDDMKAILGIYDASLGARSNETSGRAIMARQREGDVSTFHYIDNLSRAIRYCGRVLIDLIPTVTTPSA